MSKKVKVSTVARFIVRGGEKQGKYIKIREAVSPTGRKYAWTNRKTNASALTYRQAQGVVRRYGSDAVIVKVG